MPNIPIFDSPNGGVADASVRPTRIGPEEPRDTVGQAISSSAKELTAISERMNWMKDSNDLNAGNLALTDHFNNVRDQLAAQPLSQFTTKDNYVAQAKQLSDYTKVVQGFGEYSPHVRKLLQSNAQRLQDDFLNQENTQGLVLYHKSLLYNMNNNLDKQAQAYGTTSPDEAAFHRQSGLDAIDNAVQHGALSPQEGEARKKQFGNQLDVSALTNMTEEDPAAAGHLLTSPDWNKQFPSLTPQQREAGISHALTRLNQQENVSNDFLKSNESQVEAEFLNRWHSGTLTPGWADEQVQHFPDALRKYYTAAFGKKPPSEGNDPAFYSLMSQLQDHNLSLNDIDQLKISAAGAGLNAQQGKAFNDLAVSRSRGMHNELDVTRKTVGNALDQRLNQKIDEIVGNDPSVPAVYDSLHGTGAWKNYIASVRKDYGAALYSANSVDDVNKIGSTYDLESHLPKMDDGKSNKNSKGPTLPPTGKLKPPAAFSKYKNMGSIKIPGA